MCWRRSRRREKNWRKRDKGRGSRWERRERRLKTGKAGDASPPKETQQSEG